MCTLVSEYIDSITNERRALRATLKRMIPVGLMFSKTCSMLQFNNFLMSTMVYNQAWAYYDAVEFVVHSVLPDIASSSSSSSSTVPVTSSSYGLGYSAVNTRLSENVSYSTGRVYPIICVKTQFQAGDHLLGPYLGHSGRPLVSSSYDLSNSNIKVYWLTRVEKVGFILSLLYNSIVPGATSNDKLTPPTIAYITSIFTIAPTNLFRNNNTDYTRSLCSNTFNANLIAVHHDHRPAHSLASSVNHRSTSTSIWLWVPDKPRHVLLILGLINIAFMYDYRSQHTTTSLPLSYLTGITKMVLACFTKGEREKYVTRAQFMVGVGSLQFKDRLSSNTEHTDIVEYFIDFATKLARSLRSRSDDLHKIFTRLLQSTHLKHSYATLLNTFSKLSYDIPSSLKAHGLATNNGQIHKTYLLETVQRVSVMFEDVVDIRERCVTYLDPELEKKFDTFPFKWVHCYVDESNSYIVTQFLLAAADYITVDASSSFEVNDAYNPVSQRNSVLVSWSKRYMYLLGIITWCMRVSSDRKTNNTIAPHELPNAQHMCSLLDWCSPTPRQENFMKTFIGGFHALVGHTYTQTNNDADTNKSDIMKLSNKILMAICMNRNSCLSYVITGAAGITSDNLQDIVLVLLMSGRPMLVHVANWGELTELLDLEYDALPHATLMTQATYSIDNTAAFLRSDEIRALHVVDTGKERQVLCINDPVLSLDASQDGFFSVSDVHRLMILNRLVFMLNNPEADQKRQTEQLKNIWSALKLLVVDVKVTAHYFAQVFPRRSSPEASKIGVENCISPYHMHPVDITNVSAFNEKQLSSMRFRRCVIVISMIAFGHTSEIIDTTRHGAELVESSLVTYIDNILIDPEYVFIGHGSTAGKNVLQTTLCLPVVYDTGTPFRTQTLATIDTYTDYLSSIYAKLQQQPPPPSSARRQQQRTTNTPASSSLVDSIGGININNTSSSSTVSASPLSYGSDGIVNSRSDGTSMSFLFPALTQPSSSPAPSASATDSKDEINESVSVPQELPEDVTPEMLATMRANRAAEWNLMDADTH